MKRILLILSILASIYTVSTAQEPAIGQWRVHLPFIKARSVASTGDKIYCVYIAPNEEMVREHASQGGFPANRISEIKSVIDPTTAEQQSAASKQQSASS